MRNLTFTLSIRFSKITLVLWVMRLLQIKWLKNQEWQKTINFSKLSLREESHITEKFHQLAFTCNIQFLSKIHSLCYEAVTNKMARKIEHSLKTIYFWNYLTVINYTSFESLSTFFHMQTVIFEITPHSFCYQALRIRWLEKRVWPKNHQFFDVS